MKIETKRDRRTRIHLRQRKRVKGTADRPRLSVFRSEAHVYAQVIDDLSGRTLVSASSVEPAVKAQLADAVRANNVGGAKLVGKIVAERAKEQGITQVVFDRGGFLYHGRVRAMAEAAREAGLKF